MNERQLRAWLAEEAPVATPERLRVRVAAIPSEVAIGWRGLPVVPIRRTTMRLLLVAAVVAALVATALFIGTLRRTPFGVTSAYITSFAWSPDGSQLAFSVGGRRDDGTRTTTYDELYVVATQGGAPRRIDTGEDTAGLPLPVHLSWSPDARSIGWGQKVADVASGRSIDLGESGRIASVA